MKTQVIFPTDGINADVKNARGAGTVERVDVNPYLPRSDATAAIGYVEVKDKHDKILDRVVILVSGNTGKVSLRSRMQNVVAKVDQQEPDADADTTPAEDTADEE